MKPTRDQSSPHARKVHSGSVGKERVQLKQVSVPRHCPESWNGMKGSDKVRLCGTCRTNVYNLSAMSEEEADCIVDLDEACVRYFYRPDGTIVKSDESEPMRRGASRLALGAAVALAYPAAFVGLSAMVGGSETARHISIEQRDGIKLAMGIKLQLRPQQDFTTEDLAELEQLEDIEMHDDLNDEQQRRIRRLQAVELRVAMREAARAEAEEVEQPIPPELDEAVRARAMATRSQLDAMLMTSARRRHASQRNVGAQRADPEDEVPQRIDSTALPWSAGGLALGLGLLFLGMGVTRKERLQALDAWSVPQVTAVLSLLGAAMASSLAVGIGLAALGVLSLTVARRAGQERQSGNFRSRSKTPSNR